MESAGAAEETVAVFDKQQKEKEKEKRKFVPEVLAVVIRLRFVYELEKLRSSDTQMHRVSRIKKV